MMTQMRSETVDVFGDILTVCWDGNVWVSPCNGQQHSSATEAMRQELTRYMRDCGEDADSEDIQEKIEGYMSQMS